MDVFERLEIVVLFFIIVFAILFVCVIIEYRRLSKKMQWLEDDLDLLRQRSAITKRNIRSLQRDFIRFQRKIDRRLEKE
jgi:cell division protein FtsB